MSGIILALGSALLFGLSMPVTKLLLTTTDPWIAAGLLYCGAGIGLGAIRLSQHATRSSISEAPLRAGDLPRIAAVVLFGGVLAPVLLMLGLSRTTAAAASLLLNLEALATMGIAWIVFREHVDHKLLAGAGCILAGAGLLSWQGQAVAIDTGALLVGAACLAWGIDNNLTRSLSSADPLQIAMIKGLAAGSGNLGLALATGAQLPGAADTLALGAVGFLGYGVSLALFVAALRHLGAARTGAYFSLAPFVGALVGIIALQEPVTWQLTLAGGLMGIGLYLHLAERHSHQHVHDVLNHEHSHVHDEHHQHRHKDGIAASGRHSHRHVHRSLVHQHPHFPDLHHRHPHP